MAVYNEKEFTNIDVNETSELYIIKYEFSDGLAIVNDILYHDVKKKITFRYQQNDQKHIDIHIIIKKEHTKKDKWNTLTWAPLWADKFDGLFRIDYFEAEAEYIITIPKSVYLIFECKNNNKDYHFFDNENIANHTTHINNDIKTGEKYVVEFPSMLGWNHHNISKNITHSPQIHHRHNTIIFITNYDKNIKTNVTLNTHKNVSNVTIHKKGHKTTKNKCIVETNMKYILIDLQKSGNYIIDIPLKSNIDIYLANGDIKYLKPSNGSLDATATNISCCGYSGGRGSRYASWSYHYGRTSKFIKKNTSINKYIKSETDSNFQTNNGNINVPYSL